LPPEWEQPLAQRAARPATQPAKAAPPIDELLLQLEAAFDLASPPDAEAARRLMKLQAMKAALERRSSSAAAPATPEQLLAAALARSGLDAQQRQRLAAVIAALRQRTPARPR
jgi:hypothetical protein